MDTLKVAVAQLDIALGKPEENLSKLEEELTLVKEEYDIDLACVPELFLTGYDLKNLHTHTAQLPILRKKIAEIGKKFDVNLIMGLPVEENGKLYNEAWFIDNKGNFRGRYQKLHLFRPFSEHQYFTPGLPTYLKPVAFNNMWNLGLQICYDVRFPEAARTLVLQGANLLIYISEFPYPRIDIWRKLLFARAIENQCYVIGCNRVGKDQENAYFGKSLIINPLGEALSEGPENEEAWLVRELSITTITKVRKTIRALDERRPEAYKIS